MSVTIQQPNISATTPEQQLLQMRSYMYQLSRELQWAFSTLEGSSSTQYVELAPQLQTASGGTAAQRDFSEIKDLIIKSADVVSALGDQIDRKLSGKYVAQSTFGEYSRETTAAISETSRNTTINYQNIQQIMESMAESNAYIRTGELDEKDGMPVFGLEIGQTNNVDGQTTFAKVARFTADRLSFFDSNGSEVAYVSNNKLYINRADILDSIVMGRGSSGHYEVKWDRGLAFRWVSEEASD